MPSLEINKNCVLVIVVEQFSGLSKCRGLILDDNLIFDIEPKAFKGLDSLEELSLMGNQLTFIYGKTRNQIMNQICKSHEFLIKNFDEMMQTCPFPWYSDRQETMNQSIEKASNTQHLYF